MQFYLLKVLFLGRDRRVTGSDSLEVMLDHILIDRVTRSRQIVLRVQSLEHLSILGCLVRVELFPLLLIDCLHEVSVFLKLKEVPVRVLVQSRCLDHGYFNSFEWTHVVLVVVVLMIVHHCVLIIALRDASVP